MNPPVPNDPAVLGVLAGAFWLALQVAWAVVKSRVVADLAAWLRRSSMPVRAAAACALLVAVAIGGNKGGGTGPQSLPRPPALVLAATQPEPSLDVVSVRTNGASFRAASSNAVEVAAWRRTGGTEAGVWIESPTNEPFFAIGATPVFRAYASMSGTVTFESTRRPPVGWALPDSAARPEGSPHLFQPSTFNVQLPPSMEDATSASLPAFQHSTFNIQPSTLLYPALCPLRAPLGFVPEANWVAAGTQSRFWHDALPGGGRVLAWEGVLLDRLPGRRVSLQAELRPSGDCVFRYGFADALDPPATNFVIGAQTGANAVNALAVLGTNVLSATVWRVEGGASPPGEPHSLADLLCTNGVLRTPASFEIRWRNTTGLVSDADTDGDGLTDWEEVFVHGTDPSLADTDGDGLADGAEMAAGTNPLDADADGDGIPDGASAADWALNTLWATNAPDGSAAVTVTLNRAIPAGESATLVVGGLSIPLRSPASWSLGLVPGKLYAYRLFVDGSSPVDLSIGPGGTDPPLRGPMDAASLTLWLDGIGGTFDGWSLGGSGTLAIPELLVHWDDPGDGSHDSISGGICLHGGTAAVFTPTVRPEIIQGSWRLSRLEERNGKIVLQVPNNGSAYSGILTLDSGKLRFGTIQATVLAHRCDSSFQSPFCSVCGHYQPDDLTLSVRSPLTLKHRSQTAISFSHPNSSEVTIDNAVVDIRRKGTSSWIVLGSVATLANWTARIAGTFELRGRGEIDGQNVETPIVEMEVRFPVMYDLMHDSDIAVMTAEAWAATLADCTPTNRRERGFWIYLNTENESYEAGPTVYGDWCGTNLNGSVLLSPRPPDVPPSPSPAASGARYPVASFHCHTPVTYLTNRPDFEGRKVGPSEWDKHLDKNVDLVPGLVYDYIDLPYENGNIYPGHPIDSPAILYPSYGLERRPTP